MAYASPELLAEALDARVSVANAQFLWDCLEAAAAEIDHFLGGPIEGPVPPLVVRTNVNRAVEWVKAPASYNGGVGFDATGPLQAPSSGFERHAAALLPYRTQWGVA